MDVPVLIVIIGIAAIAVLIGMLVSKSKELAKSLDDKHEATVNINSLNMKLDHKLSQLELEKKKASKLIQANDRLNAELKELKKAKKPARKPARKPRTKKTKTETKK